MAYSSFNALFLIDVYPEKGPGAPENELKSRWENLLGPDYEVMVCFISRYTPNTIIQNDMRESKKTQAASIVFFLSFFPIRAINQFLKRFKL